MIELLNDADRVLAYATEHGRATVMGDDGDPDIIVSVLQPDTCATCGAMSNVDPVGWACSDGFHAPANGKKGGE